MFAAKREGVLSFSFVTFHPFTDQFLNLITLYFVRRHATIQPPIHGRKGNAELISKLLLADFVLKAVSFEAVNQIHNIADYGFLFWFASSISLSARISSVTVGCCLPE